MAEHVSKEHLRMAGVVKHVHSELRRKLRSGKPFHEVWNEHLSQESTLQEYAKSMELLATHHWAKEVDPATCRINWTYSKIQQYFHGGGLVQQLYKDKRRAERNSASTECEVDPPIPLRVQMLDVGSCYNPFYKYSDVDVTAVDIAPARDEVLICDFINVPIKSEREFDGRKLISLGAESFHVILFCLLLEYIPSQLARLECCEKASKVLKKNGILIIITPGTEQLEQSPPLAPISDSSHQNKNSVLIRGWKQVLSQIGFAQVYYEKKQHFHGLVFRKLGEEEMALVRMENSLIPLTREEMIQRFQIPQDSNPEVSLESTPELEIDPDTILDHFSELPDFFPDT
ncbi:probable methyltransferase BMT2 homolog isoform X2 [Eurytemora carolleeae]|uniref:probable methyltransferase BMT2 homolog isoform X2 n=1 Tax=Eurytemora carolleeae TaxID=1294199 RepID=UPI000C78C82D|nr:probable methyltransferase BMT2 homolog isoform X2 [Eurytemora carolleeae]|eukprot:XP_023342826.1 probable methyltransferase BMT2 homolog isoform X2 [Eurytemora affinis]